MPNWMIDNRTTKLVSVLKEQLQSNTDVSLMLKSLSLSGFASLYDQLKGNKARLLLGMDDTSLTKRLACDPGEEKLLHQLDQKELASALHKWLQTRVSAKGVAGSRLTQILYHLKKANDEQAFIQGSSDLTAAGLGLIFSDRMDMNLGSTDADQAGAMRLGPTPTS